MELLRNTYCRSCKNTGRAKNNFERRKLINGKKPSRIAGMYKTLSNKRYFKKQNTR